MDLYVEKEFINKINQDYKDNNNNPSLEIIVSILKEYGDVRIYIDCDDDNLKVLENENYLIAIKTTHSLGPIPINSNIKDHFFKVSNHEQTLVFTYEKQSWFEEAEQKGAICFSYENYNEKIAEILNICNAIKVDLSENFAGWDNFSELKKIPKNKILINDKYFFDSNGGNDPIKENIIPLFKNIIAENSKLSIEIFTDFLNTKKENKNIKPIDINKIKSSFNNIFRRDFDIVFEYIHFNFHDRILYSNFFMIECPIGFNFNKRKIENSKITVDSIFDKFNYKRINNHFRLHKEKKDESVVV
jgi:hypothetical protein